MTEGDILNVTATIQNTGNDTGTQTIELRSFGGTAVDTESVTLAPDGSTTTTLAWQTGSGDAGSDEIRVESDQDGANESAVVLSTVPVSGEPISDCTTLYRPGSYVLTNNLSFSPDSFSDTPCIDVPLGDVDIDGQGYTVEGAPGSNGGTGVLVEGQVEGNVTLRDLELRNVSDGVRLGELAENGTISELTVENLTLRRIDSSLDGGINVDSLAADNTTLEKLTVRDSEFGTDGASFPAIAVDETGRNATLKEFTLENSSTADNGLTLGGLIRSDEMTFADIRISNSTLGDTVKMKIGANSTVQDIQVTDSKVNASSGGIAIDYNRGSTVENVRIANSTFDSGVGTAIEFASLTGDGVQTRNVTIRDNEITAESTGGTGVAALFAQNNVVLEGFDIVDNTVESTATAVDLLGVGDQTVYEANVTGNTLRNFSRQGIKPTVNVHDADTSIDIVDNTIVSETGSATGVELSTRNDSSALTQPVGTVYVGFNEIRTGGDAVKIRSTSEWVETINISHNHLETSAFGVNNEVSSVAGTDWVTATENYWGNSTGPDSAGPYADPVTGTLADGDGSSVSGSVSTANVHFEPWLQSSPFSTSNFTVTIDSTNSPVTEGDTLRINATVQNELDQSHTEMVALELNGTQRNSTTVTLDSGNATSVNLSYDTKPGDAGSYTATVTSEDGSDSSAVTVLEPASFDVTITSVDSTVTEGEPITVAYEVTNTGDVTDTQDLTFAVNGTTEDTELGVTLNGSETFSGQFNYATAAGDAPAVSVMVSSADDSATEAVAVNEPASFDVTITSVESTVTEGETITVNYEVTNTGGAQATQDIKFAVNGTSEDTESGVTLNGSETFSGQFAYATVGGDAPAVSVNVSSDDDSATEAVTVNEPASFDVTITSVGSAVTEGETVTVSYEVTNTGDVTDTQNLTFAVNGTSEDTESGVTLNESETFSGQFSYATVAGDAPAVSVVVSSADDSATETVTVNEPASFEVTLTSVSSTVTAGETITASYEVTNTGDVQSVQEITFAVNGTTEDTKSGVLLNGSETFSGQFAYTTSGGDTPAVSLNISSENDSVIETVTVNDPASFDVTITSVESTVTEGETITVAYDVTNTGDVQATQDITFTVNGSSEDTESGVTLNGSGMFSGQFAYATSDGDAPAVSVAVSSEDDSATETVTVNEPSSFDVTITSVESAVTEGETITVDYEVTNTGDVQATQDITFAVNGTSEDTESGVTLNGSETFSGQFTYSTSTGDAPAVSVSVSSEDDSATETVTVNEPAVFDVMITSVESAVTEGEMITVNYEVTNTGGAQATQDITFAVNGTSEETESGVTLNESETFSGQFTYSTSTGDAPAVSVAVSSADDLATATVTVNEPSSFDVTITSVDSAVTEGETITVAYEVTNTGDVTDTQDLTFAVNGTSEDTESGVTLNESETFSGQFTYSTVAGDAPAVSVAVSSADDLATATVTVNEPSLFDVTITSVDSAVTEGETITVDYEVTNTGDVQATQDIAFAVNGTTEDTESGVTLNGSEMFSGQFAYTTSDGDAPAVSVAMSSEDDSAIEMVTVKKPASFDVTITSVESAVTEGETVTVAYELQNTGDVRDTQNVTLAVNGTTEDTESGVTLNGSETFSGQFTYNTVAGDAPAVSVTVSSEDGSATETVTVNEPSSFDVTITSVESAVTEGETITVSYEIENTGDVQATQDITFAVNGTSEDTESGVKLNESETFSGQFTYSTSTGDAPAMSVSVSSEDDSTTETVTVNEPSSFDVMITSVDSAVTEGETITVDYEVTNTGDVQATQDLTFTVNGSSEDTESGVTLNESETFSGQFTYSTSTGDAPAVSVAVSSADDLATATVTVNEPSSFDVTITSVDASVAEGETITVDYEVTNTGDVQATQDITFAVNGTTEDTESGVTLNRSETFSDQFSHATVAGDAPAVSLNVSSENDSATETVTVLVAAEFTVEILEANTPVEGERLSVTANIQNTGDVGDTQTVTLSVGTLGANSTTVTLGGNSATNLSLSVGTGSGDAGSYTAAVSSDDDTDDITATVASDAVDRVEVSPSSDQIIRAGETVEFNATAFSQGTVVEDYDAAFDWDAEGGSLSGSGLFTETGLGAYNVTAEFGNVTSGETTVVVERGLATYANESGIINNSGLLTAVDDWRDDRINTFLLFDVVDAWRSGALVTGAGRLWTAGHGSPRESGEGTRGTQTTGSQAYRNGHPHSAVDARTGITTDP